jgi:glutathione S-transferase
MTVLTGRSSSHFTRLVRVFAGELGVPHEFTPIYDLRSVDPKDYAGNPALKLPALKLDGATIFGTDNICRALHKAASRPKQVIWPEDLPDVRARNAQEFVWHAMQAQVQLAFGIEVARLPADNIYFSKAATGLRNVLAWLDERWPAIEASLPSRDISVLEVALFCLIEHLEFRATVSPRPYDNLIRFARDFGQRPSAIGTPFRFDVKPA